MRHGERRVQVGGRLIVLHGPGLIAGMLPAERHQVVGPGVQFIESQNMQADLLGFSQLAAIGQKHS
jgi:hypothetical protein